MYKKKRDKKTSSKFLFTWACYLVCLIGYAQEPLVKNFNQNNGLPSNECYRVLQDEQGYIWVASDAGLSRYNGYTFENFTKQDGLPDNVIIHLFKDPKNRIWAVGLNSKICYYEKGRFYPLTQFNSLIDTIPKRAIMVSVYINDKEELKMGFNRFYPHLLTFSLKTKQLVSQKEILENTTQLELDEKGQNFIYSFKELPAVWHKVHIDKKGISCLKDTLLVSVESQHTRYLSISKDSFLVSIKNRVYVVNRGEAKEFFQSSDVVYCLYKDRWNRIWILGVNSGVHIFTPSANGQYTVEHLFGEMTFTGICEDREGSLWLSSANNGIYQIPDAQIINYMITEGGRSIKINTACVFNHKTFCAGVGKWIYEFNEKDGFQHFYPLNYPHFLFPQRKEETFVMQEWKKKLVVCGAFTSILEINSSGFKQHELKSWAGGKYVKIISPSFSAKQFIIANSKWFLPVFNDSSGKYNFYTTGYETSGILRSVYLDTLTDVIYLGCDNGFFRWNKGEFFPYSGTQEPLKERINYINKAGNTFILSTKEKGLFLWDGKNLRIIDAKNGLCSNDCRKTEFDRRGNLWMATAKGITQIKNWNSQKPSLNTFTRNEGLPADDIYTFCIRDNEIWIPNNTGICKMSIHAENSLLPPIYITSIIIDDRIYRSDFPAEIPYKHNYLDINFNGLSYKNNIGIEYKYRLIGIDSVWKKTKNPHVEFSTLPAGNYRFEIYAVKNFSTLSEKAAIYEFVIYPPIYKRTWFIFLLAVTFICITYLFFLIRFKRLKKREEEKTKLMMKIRETEMKALRAQTNPHFIFNALNSIRLFILQNNSDQAQHYLMQFTYLMREVLENSEKDMITIEQEFSVLSKYIELESLRFMNKFTYEIIFPEECTGRGFFIPPLLLQPIVENSIWHGLMPLEGKSGKLTIKASCSMNNLVITIEDNGIGRKKSAELKAGKTQHKTSKGIGITDDRIQLFNQKNKGTITLFVFDLFDSSGQSIGTKTELNILHLKQ